MFLILFGMVAWLATVVWQLWLAETKGKIWARTEYITRESNETTLGACVASYWVMLGVGIVMFYVLIIVALKGGISD
jgi:hypothetical protein